MAKKSFLLLAFALCFSSIAKSSPRNCRESSSPSVEGENAIDELAKMVKKQTQQPSVSSDGSQPNSPPNALELPAARETLDLEFQAALEKAQTIDETSTSGSETDALEAAQRELLLSVQAAESRDHKVANLLREETMASLIADLQGITDHPAEKQDVGLKSKTLRRISRRIAQSDSNRSYFIADDLNFVLNLISRNHFYNIPGYFEETAEVLYVVPTLHLGSVRDFLSAVTKHGSDDSLLKGLSVKGALQMLHAITNVKMRDSKDNRQLLIDTVRLAHEKINPESIVKFPKRELFLYAWVLGRNSIILPSVFRDAITRRLLEIMNQFTKEQRIHINNFLALAEFEPIPELYERIFNDYEGRTRYANKDEDSEVSHKRDKFFFEITAGALFNQGAPEEWCDRFVNLFIQSRIELKNHPEFDSTQSLMVYEHHVKGRKRNLINVAPLKPIQGLPPLDDDKGASVSEDFVYTSLKALFPNEKIIREAKVAPGVPPLDFFIPGRRLFIESQGEHHASIKLRVSNLGSLSIDRSRGRLYDLRKTQIIRSRSFGSKGKFRVLEFREQVSSRSVEDLIEKLKFQIPKAY